MKWANSLTVAFPLLLVSFLFIFFAIPPRSTLLTSDTVSLADTHRVIAAHNRRMLRGGLLLRDESNSSQSYAVIFDAGSTGSRVHVFCFDESMDLLPIDDSFEFYKTVRPGLSSYASDPKEAANSLKPLLEAAESVVPTDLQSETPVGLGATAGLRALEGNTSVAILEAVRDLLHNSSLKYKTKWVTIIDGTQEGSYLWITMNYLLGNLGKEYSNTVGVIDLGGGSVQMAYAVSEKAAANSPKDETYVNQSLVLGTKYYLYVHSYANYGNNAARVKILKAMGGSGNACILDGFDGTYTYNGVTYEVSSSDSGSNFIECRNGALKALNLNQPCAYKNCTFGGVWNGGGGDGQKNLYLASSFYYKAEAAGLIKPSEKSAVVQPLDYKEAAKVACKLSLKDAATAYPSVSNRDLPYLCMDFVYQYTLLVDGFGLDPERRITVVKAVQYKKYSVEAAWPLGSALEIMSPSTTSLSYHHVA